MQASVAAAIVGVGNCFQFCRETMLPQAESFTSVFEYAHANETQCIADNNTCFETKHSLIAEKFSGRGGQTLHTPSKENICTVAKQDDNLFAAFPAYAAEKC